MPLRHTIRLTTIGLWLCLAAALPARATPVNVALREVAPYVFKDESGQWRGMEYEIIAESFAHEGFNVLPTIVPFARVLYTYANDPTIDAASPILPSFQLGGFLTDSHVTFANVARALIATDLRIDTVLDLSGKSIVAFQNARLVLGPAFEAVTANNPLYREEANQVYQVKMLYAGRTDLIVGDRRIFNFQAASPANDIGLTPVVDFRLFPPTSYSLVCRSEAVGRAFNRGLAALKSSGGYARILDRYGG